jgi:Protein of unknown function (DUF2637)
MRAVVTMTGTDLYQILTALAVLLVAPIAAVISYQHVVALAIRYGQPAVAVYLLPVSIDGLVAVSSLVMLRAAWPATSATAWHTAGQVRCCPAGQPWRSW